MAWCPQCKEEYEDYVEMCSDCKVALVQSIEDVSTERILVMVNTLDEANKVIDFLEYSNIITGRIEESVNDLEEPLFLVFVEGEDWDEAARFMQGFAMVEKEEPNKEDYYFDEYQTIDVEGTNELTDIKSSYQAFIGLGIIMVGLGGLHLLTILTIFSGSMPIVMTSLGVIMVLGGVLTKNKINAKVEHYKSLKEAFEEIYTWYIESFPVDSFYERHEVDVSELDDGAKYFALMDLIVKECETTTLTEDDKMINTVADKIYHQL